MDNKLPIFVYEGGDPPDIEEVMEVLGKEATHGTYGFLEKLGASNYVCSLMATKDGEVVMSHPIEEERLGTILEQLMKLKDGRLTIIGILISKNDERGVKRAADLKFGRAALTVQKYTPAERRSS